MQGNYSVIATIAVGVIIIGAVAYGIYSTNSSLSALSGQNTSLKGQIGSLNQQLSSANQQLSSVNQQVSTLNQQVSVLEQRTITVVTVSNTVVTLEVSTSVSTATSFVTNTLTSTVTTTSNVYPPSNSTYTLTYVDGNATNHEPSCGSFVLSVFITYELHKPLPSNLVVWAKFDNGVLYQPSSQQVYVNQAYVTVYASYSYSSGYCGVGIPGSVTSWVTDSRNQVLGPFETFVVIKK
ncbi:MAG: hypothetical protein ABSB29_05120 [Nitrososphaerales archaeon]|jgi:TolA-binding protein